MNWLLAFLSLLIGGITGRAISVKMRRREKLLTELCTLCDYICANLRYRKDPIVQILSEHVKSAPQTEKFMRIFRDNLDETDNMKAQVKAAASEWKLSEAEADQAAEFYACLGRSDTDTQLGRIAHFKEAFAAAKDEAHADVAKNANLAQKLGLLIGGGIAIVLL